MNPLLRAPTQDHVEDAWHIGVNVNILLIASCVTGCVLRMENRAIDKAEKDYNPIGPALNHSCMEEK